VNWAIYHNPVAERKALTLLEGIVKENGKSLKLEGDKLTVSRSDGRTFLIELQSSKVYDASGKSICVRVGNQDLPIIDQVIAKSIYLLTSPRPSVDLDNDLLYKVTLAGLDPSNEWAWIRSFSQTSLSETFSTLIGADFAVKAVKVGGFAVKLQLWYVNYGNRFESIRMRHIRGSMGAVILCNDRSANRNAESFQVSINEVRSCNTTTLPMIFVGLYDENPNRNYEDSRMMEVGKEVARCNGIPFFACSVNHPSTTVKPLVCLTEMILKRQLSRRETFS
jgi:hypothetical protein